MPTGLRFFLTTCNSAVRFRFYSRRNAVTGSTRAARRAGIKTVILPERNMNDLDDVPEDLRKEMTFIPVERIDQVIAAALHPQEGA